MVANVVFLHSATGPGIQHCRLSWRNEENYRLHVIAIFVRFRFRHRPVSVFV